MQVMPAIYSIELPFPPSSNTAYPTGKTGKRFLSEKGKDWYALALPEIEAVLMGMDTPAKISMTFHFAFPDNRARDLLNYVKLPQDAVCSILGVDDNHTIVPDMVLRSLGVDKHNPRCVVIVQALEVQP